MRIESHVERSLRFMDKGVGSSQRILHRRLPHLILELREEVCRGGWAARASSRLGNMGMGTNVRIWCDTIAILIRCSAAEKDLIY